MSKDFTVYQMKKFMRKNGDNRNRKEQKFFKKLIDATLTFNNIDFIVRPEFQVFIPNFNYEPRIDLVYFIDKKKIGIEVDGAYHDTIRQEHIDNYRDAKLAELGWIIHRLKSWRYEPVFNNQIDFENLQIINKNIFNELQNIFGWKKILSSDELKHL